MPLRDHFRPPLSESRSWEGLYGGWPMVIVQQLGAKLPDGYVAEPRVHLGAQVEIDVATFDEEEARTHQVKPAATSASPDPVAIVQREDTPRAGSRASATCRGARYLREVLCVVQDPRIHVGEEAS